MPEQNSCPSSKPGRNKKAKPSQNGAVRHLSPEEIAELAGKYARPLTTAERHAKQSKDAVRPDTSHLTPWAP
jgi:hypothetical protein